MTASHSELTQQTPRPTPQPHTATPQPHAPLFPREPFHRLVPRPDLPARTAELLFQRLELKVPGLEPVLQQRQALKGLN
jgi:hypothetical protein